MAFLNFNYFRCQYVKSLIIYTVVIYVQRFKLKCKNSTFIFLFLININHFSNLSGVLDGVREKPNYKDLVSNPVLRYSGVFEHNDLYVTCHIYSDGQELCMPIKTSYKYIDKPWK